MIAALSILLGCACGVLILAGLIWWWARAAEPVEDQPPLFLPGDKWLDGVVDRDVRAADNLDKLREGM